MMLSRNSPRTRLERLCAALDPEHAPSEASMSALSALLTDNPSASQLWLTWAVLTTDLPTMHEILWAQRQVKLSGVERLVARLASRGRKLGGLATPDVQIVSGAVLVDVFHTSQTKLTTGIQRVARETVQRWDKTHDIQLVTWTADGRALRALTASERVRALTGAKLDRRGESVPRARIVPWGGHYLLPELAAEQWRTERLGALAEYSGAASGVIGFDCVPLTSVETVGEGMAAAFARNLGAVRHMGRVSTISRAAGNEYSGWKQMLPSIGVLGPDIRPIGLAASSQEASPEAIAAAASLLGVQSDVPMVLVVGSHEPRKNHLAVLAAAESLWAKGLDFRLVFIGGNSWKSHQFDSELANLQQRGRSTASMSAISDSLLWAAYRLARFTVFPSLNEGFGLPVAESLSCGTPAITSNYGSMREIAEDGGGVLLVDPYDDASIAAGMLRLLTDQDELGRLVAEAKSRTPRTWDDYAAELWSYFVDEDASASR